MNDLCRLMNGSHFTRVLNSHEYQYIRMNKHIVLRFPPRTNDPCSFITNVIMCTSL